MSSPVSFWETFAEVPDPRDASGRRHPLQPVLTLASVAILSGARSLYAIAVRAGPGQEFARRCWRPGDYRAWGRKAPVPGASSPAEDE